MTRVHSHASSHHDALAAIFHLTQEKKPGRGGAFLSPRFLSRHPPPATDFGHLPVFVDPRAKINKSGKVENLAEFGSIKEIFNMEKCLCCYALTDDYGASHENPCMKCLDLMAKITTENTRQ